MSGATKTVVNSSVKTMLLPVSEQCSSSAGGFLFQIDKPSLYREMNEAPTHSLYVSPHLHCIVSDSVKSGRCWPTRTKRSRSHLLVSGGRNKVQ